MIGWIGRGDRRAGDGPVDCRLITGGLDVGLAVGLLNQGRCRVFWPRQPQKAQTRDQSQPGLGSRLLQVEAPDQSIMNFVLLRFLKRL